VRAVVVHMAHLLHKLRQPSVPATSTVQSSILQTSTASSTTSSLVLASAAQQDWLALDTACTVSSSSLSSSSSSSSAVGESLALHHRQHLALEALQLYVPVSNALGLGAAFRELEELGYKVSVCVYCVCYIG
jgi:hypothetical protein